MKILPGGSFCNVFKFLEKQTKTRRITFAGSLKLIRQNVELLGDGFIARCGKLNGRVLVDAGYFDLNIKVAFEF